MTATFRRSEPTQLVWRPVEPGSKLGRLSTIGGTELHQLVTLTEAGEDFAGYAIRVTR